MDDRGIDAASVDSEGVGHVSGELSAACRESLDVLRYPLQRILSEVLPQLMFDSICILSSPLQKSGDSSAIDTSLPYSESLTAHGAGAPMLVVSREWHQVTRLAERECLCDEVEPALQNTA